MTSETKIKFEKINPLPVPRVEVYVDHIVTVEFMSRAEVLKRFPFSKAHTAA